MNTSSTTNTAATKTASTAYSRFRKAAAPSWIARAMFCIVSFPSPSRTTANTRKAEKRRASAPAMMAKIRISMVPPETGAARRRASWGSPRERQSQQGLGRKAL